MSKRATLILLIILSFFEAQSYTFLDSLQVSLAKVQTKGQLYYRFTDKDSNSWLLYTKSLQLTKTILKVKLFLLNLIRLKKDAASF